jgi:hypothetical protein
MSEWLINRKAIEENLGHSLSEEQWTKIAEEVAGRVDNFIEEIMDGVIQSALEEEEGEE